MIGQTISHYRILEKLGEGGMGVVYQAEDLKLKRTVALKFLPPELTRDKQAKTRFIHEAQAASALQQHNICTIHEIDETPDGRLFICMDCYEGETLKEKIAKGPLPIDEAVDIARQVAAGLSKAHQAGMVHRDVKPANIIVTKEGEVKILDFGLAKLAGQTKVTRTGTTVGTVAYMSPEQATGRELDARSDIWSLGVVLYEMLTGQLPFKGEHEQALLYQIVNVEPEPLAKHRDDIPDSLGAVVDKTLQKDPSRRHQSAAAMVEDLLSLAGGTPLPRWTAATQHGGRRRALLVTLVSAIVVITIAVVLFWNLSHRGGPPEPSGKRSIAVMPFENLTGDSGFDVWKDGLSELITTKLSESEELRVLDRQAARDALLTMGYSRASAISFPVAQDVASRLGASTIITGSIMKAGVNIRVQTKLQDAVSGELLLSKFAEGLSESDFFAIADSAALQLQDHLEIGVLKGKHPEFVEDALMTSSAAAYRHYILGMEARNDIEWDVAIDHFNKALAIDSSFIMAKCLLAETYVNKGDVVTGFALHDQVLKTIDVNSLPPKLRYEFRAAVAYKSRNMEDAIVWRRKILEMNPLDPERWRTLGFLHYSIEDYGRAADDYEKALEIQLERDKDEFRFPVPGLYFWFFGKSLFKLGRYDRAIEMLELGRKKMGDKYFPLMCIEFWLAANHLAQGDTVQAETSRQACHSLQKALGWEDSAYMMMWDAELYAENGDMDRALSIYRDIAARYPEYWGATNAVAYYLIDKEINVEEGMRLVQQIVDKHPDALDSKFVIPWDILAHQDVHHTMGLGYYRQGKYQDAVTALENACDKLHNYHRPTYAHLEIARTALEEERKRNRNQ